MAGYTCPQIVKRGEITKKIKLYNRISCTQVIKWHYLFFANEFLWVGSANNQNNQRRNSVINEWKNSVRLTMYYATKYFFHKTFFVFVPAGQGTVLAKKMTSGGTR
jgi:hypothetical protein